MEESTSVIRKSPSLRKCPVETTLNVIGGKWKGFIILYLQDGAKRFNELKEMMPGVTQRMLTLHLRELEEDGIILRTVLPVSPPHVNYQLTELGKSFSGVFFAIADWGKKFQKQQAELEE